MRRRDEAAGGRRGKAAAAPQSAGQEHLNGAQPPPCLPAAAALAAYTPARARPAEGQRLQQQAERNKDNGARCGIFASAAERFRAALQHALSADDRADAAFGLVRSHDPARIASRTARLRGLPGMAVPADASRCCVLARQGECLQRWAEAHVSAARAAPLSAGLLAAEASAGAASATLCQQSLEAYALVRGDDGAPREDALVNRRVARAPSCAASRSKARVSPCAVATCSALGPSSWPMRRRRRRRRCWRAPARRTRRRRQLRLLKRPPTSSYCARGLMPSFAALSWRLAQAMAHPRTRATAARLARMLRRAAAQTRRKVTTWRACFTTGVAGCSLWPSTGLAPGARRSTWSWRPPSCAPPPSLAQGTPTPSTP